MAKWNGNIISKNARYRTQTVNQARGIYNLDEQLMHKGNTNWPMPATGLGDDAGYWFSDLTIIETTTSADNSDNYSFATAPLPASASQGRVYLAVQVTANTTFYNDFCIGWVQIPHDNGNSLNTTGDASTNVDWQMDTYGTSWQRGSAVTSSNDTLSSVSGYTWTNIANGNTVNRWNRATSTGSQRTGALGGMDEGLGFNLMDETSFFTVPGNNPTSVVQTNTSYYIYTETSGATQGSIIWCRSPEVTLTGSNHVLVVAYHACTSSGGIGMTNTTSEKLLRGWWEES